MPNTEVAITIVGNTTLTLNDFSSGTPAYLLRNLARLLSSLSTRQTRSDKQGDHGVYDSLSQYGPRMLPFDGEINGSSQSDRKSKEEDLKWCLALRAIQSYSAADGYYLVKITDEDSSLKQCYAKIVDPPTFDVLDDIDPSRRGFGFVMMAKDPRLYSQTLQTATGNETYQGTNFQVVQGVSPTVPFQLYQTTAASTTATNGGKYDAPPVITVAGPTTSPKITNVTTGYYILLTGLTLLAGESVAIDVGKGTIKKNDGTNLSSYWASGSTWWTLVPGANTITLLDSSPSLLQATLTIQWRDTWL